MENAFDVFISFKNTDKNGERTQDSIMAEEMFCSWFHGSRFWLLELRCFLKILFK